MSEQATATQRERTCDRCGKTIGEDVLHPGDEAPHVCVPVSATQREAIAAAIGKMIGVYNGQLIAEAERRLDAGHIDEATYRVIVSVTLIGTEPPPAEVMQHFQELHGFDVEDADAIRARIGDSRENLVPQTADAVAGLVVGWVDEATRRTPTDQGGRRGATGEMDQRRRRVDQRTIRNRLWMGRAGQARGLYALRIKCPRSWYTSWVAWIRAIVGTKLLLDYGERCSCGRRVGLVWHAPDDYWLTVMPSHGGVLCPRCFGERCEAAGLTRFFVWRPVRQEDASDESGWSW